MFGAVGFTPINFLTKLRATEALLWACYLLLFNRLKLIKFNLNLTGHRQTNSTKLCTNCTKSTKFKNMPKLAQNANSVSLLPFAP
jgi:hypothetical protein